MNIDQLIINKSGKRGESNFNDINICKKSPTMYKFLSTKLIGKLNEEFFEGIIKTTNFRYDMIGIIDTLSSNLNGILVVKKTPCRKRKGSFDANPSLYGDAYTIEAICTNEGGLSSLLLGCYLYTIKLNDNVQPKLGLLEVDGGYKNPAAYCSYAKLGFTITGEARDCFKTVSGKLPMSIDLSDIDQSEIIHRTATSALLKQALCSISRSDQHKQMKLATFLDLKDKMVSHFEDLPKKGFKKKTTKLFNLDDETDKDLFLSFFVLSYNGLKKIFQSKKDITDIDLTKTISKIDDAIAKIIRGQPEPSVAAAAPIGGKRKYKTKYKKRTKKHYRSRKKYSKRRRFNNKYTK